MDAKRGAERGVREYEGREEARGVKDVRGGELKFEKDSHEM